MESKFKKYGLQIILLLSAWLFVSFTASSMQAAMNDSEAMCSKRYYIEYFIFTDLFCEVKNETN